MRERDGVPIAFKAYTHLQVITANQYNDNRTRLFEQKYRPEFLVWNNQHLSFDRWTHCKELCTVKYL